MFFILYVCISFQAKQENISGDFRGDVYQNGGTLVIAPGLSYMLLFEIERGGAAYYVCTCLAVGQTDLFIGVLVTGCPLNILYKCQGFHLVCICFSGGKVLLLYKQENPSDHINTSEILQVLGINAES